MSISPQRVAILGGGVGAMTAAWELSRPEHAGKYDITVYQMGWRIGGQGASGRNADAGDRIEEHGLHAWGGFYENAFRLMAEVYAELGRKPGQPLARLWDPGNAAATDVAYKMHKDVVFCEFIDGQWVPWRFPFAHQPGLPGEMGDIPTVEEMAGRSLQTLLRQLGLFIPYFDRTLGTLASALVRRVLGAMQPAGTPPAKAPGSLLDQVMDLAGRETRLLLQGPLLAELFDFLDRLGVYLQKYVVPLVKDNTRLRRDLIILDFLRVSVSGLYREKVAERGFDHLEDVEFSEWLRQNGAMPITLDSVLVRGFYDYMFAFLNGDPSAPCISAGTALWHSLRLTVGYRGAPFFLMQAGMGDTVFAPFYLTLKRRGVKFRFFHRVDQLNADPNTKAITSVELTRQVKLKGEEYQPLYDVKGLPCWPNLPLFEQIEGGPDLERLLRQHSVNLEAPAEDTAPWKDEEKLTLEAGRDFDLVISNLSIAALAVAGKGLHAANSGIALLTFKVKTVPTVAVQLWFNRSLSDLGWTSGTPILTGYQRPNSTWGDLSHLLPRENWEKHNRQPPKSIAYFCGPLLFPASVPLLKDDAGRKTIPHVVAALARQWFQDSAWQLFPQATSPTNPTALNYDFLYPSGLLGIPNLRAGFDKAGLDTGLMLFDEQYVRGNVTPAERYVISTPGDRNYRPREGDSGITNLYFVGDWIYTGLGSCVESAAMSGLMVARRLTGSPQNIPGELPQTRLGFKAKP